MANNCTFELIMLKKLDEELKDLMQLINTVDPCDPNYKKLVESMEKLMSARQKLIETVDPNLLDTRNGWQKFVDKIDPTEIIKVVIVGGFALVIMKHEELEVISGKAFDIIARSFRI